MTPFEIIKDAYDRAGVSYAVQESDGYYYLVLCAKHNKEAYEGMSFHYFLSHGFMEFYSDGSIASY